MALDPQTFTVTPQQFDQMKLRVQKELGISIPADSGQQSARGITIRWNYERPVNRLTLQCLGKPFVVPGRVVQSRIEQLVNESV